MFNSLLLSSAGVSWNKTRLEVCKKFNFYNIFKQIIKCKSFKNITKNWKETDRSIAFN